MATVADEIRGLALSNIMNALKEDAVILEIGSVLADSKVQLHRDIITNATYVMDWLDADTDCPTCPYLDSLEDEEEDFSECGAGEDGSYTAEDHAALEAFVAAQVELDAQRRADFSPDLGTFLIFCRN